jgi:hypothetical protein
VEAELLGLEGRVVVLGDGVLGHEEGVLQAAGRQEAAAEAAQPTEALRLVAPGAGEAGVGLPAERQPPQLAAADVHRPVDHDVEPEAAAGAELQHPRPPLQPVGQLDQADAADLRQPANMPQQVLPSEVFAPELDHADMPPRSRTKHPDTMRRLISGRWVYHVVPAPWGGAAEPGDNGGCAIGAAAVVPGPRALQGPSPLEPDRFRAPGNRAHRARRVSGLAGQWDRGIRLLRRAARQ